MDKRELETILNEINERLKRIEHNIELSSWIAVIVFGFAILFFFWQLYETKGDLAYILLMIGAGLGISISYLRLKTLEKQKK